MIVSYPLIHIIFLRTIIVHIILLFFCGKAKVAEFFSSSRVPRIHSYRAFFCYQVIECAYNMYLSVIAHIFFFLGE